MAWPDIVAELLRTEFTNFETFHVCKEVRAIVVLTWSNSADLRRVCETFRTAGLFGEHYDLGLWFCNSFRTFRGVLSRTNTIVSLYRTLLSDRERFGLFAKLLR